MFFTFYCVAVQPGCCTTSSIFWPCYRTIDCLLFSLVIRYNPVIIPADRSVYPLGETNSFSCVSPIINSANRHGLELREDRTVNTLCCLSATSAKSVIKNFQPGQMHWSGLQNWVTTTDKASDNMIMARFYKLSTCSLHVGNTYKSNYK